MCVSEHQDHNFTWIVDCGTRYPFEIAIAVVDSTILYAFATVLNSSSVSRKCIASKIRWNCWTETRPDLNLSKSSNHSLAWTDRKYIKDLTRSWQLQTSSALTYIPGLSRRLSLILTMLYLGKLSLAAVLLLVRLGIELLPWLCSLLDILIREALPKSLPENGYRGPL